MRKVFRGWFHPSTLFWAGVLICSLVSGLFPGPVGAFLHGIGSFYATLLIGSLVLGVLAPLAMAALSWLYEQAERAIRWVYADIGQSYYRREIEPGIIGTRRLPEFGDINNGKYRVVAEAEESDAVFPTPHQP